MSLAADTLPAFDSRFARELPELCVPWQGTVPAAELLALNEPLAHDLGLVPEHLRSPEGLALLVGAAAPAGATPVAQGYSGHQFGALSPRLGDGRALLVGELRDRHGRVRDLHLKGSGRTPFSRGGDGKAAVGPMLREYVVSEAMQALGIPTTRSLAVVATGETVLRETPLPGAVLARVAASHLRVGTFEYAAMHPDPEVLRRLADHAIARHHPHAAEADDPYLALFEAVVDAQAALVASWMLVGFIHGVMNTDNVTISGETIDYGPCAFMEAYDPATVFSSIDHGGRYAFANQPAVMQWNLARFAEALLGLLAPEPQAAATAAGEVLQTFGERFDRRWRPGLHAKLGLPEGPGTDEALAGDLLGLMQEHELDWTATFRSLAAVLRGAPAELPDAVDPWLARWRAQLPADPGQRGAVADAMDRVNPRFIPRNQQVEEALAAATAGDVGPLHRLVEVVRRPFEDRPGLEAYAAPAPACDGPYRTFCGT
ncbi:MAG TPA: YdiU family protein [Baekduia sp.]|nr:YdiU family protein [Baekduia sp.]